MSSLSFSKLKSYLPTFTTSTTGDNHSNVNSGRKSKGLFETFEPEVGFKLTLDPGSMNRNHAGSTSSSSNSGSTVPELIVNLIGARHLPSSFGLKRVEGYVIKVKLFPGSAKYDSSIQTSSWPSFNENFRFPLAPSTKSSFRLKNKDSNESSSKFQTPPEKLFKGHFVVLTVYALLELPPGALPTMRAKFEKLRRKSSLLLNDKQSAADKNDSETKDKDKVDIMTLTTSETRRNIGSVTCFLDPKLFEEQQKTNHYVTEEMWLNIKDITVTPSSSSATTSTNQTINSSPKGQVEIILQIFDPNAYDPTADHTHDKEISNKSTHNSNSSKSTEDTVHKDDHNSFSMGGWSLNEVKRKISGHRKDKFKGLSLKITTSKMRCSIKVKEEFENVGAPIYIKTTIFEHDILSNYWKSDTFLPSLSTRWNPDQSTIVIPLVDDNSLENISIKISIGTKTKVGKKIYLGTLHMGPNSKDLKLEHWQNMITNKGTPVSMWHSFE